jgi:hypothetical protein
MSHLVRMGLSVAVVLLTACAMTAEKTPPPDWVSGEARHYPAHRYLLGRGEAGTIEDAANRARADLARVFEVKVTAQSRDVQTFEQRSGDNARDQKITSGSLQLTRSIATDTENVLRGARIAETWQEPVTGLYHALAVLERAPAAAGLRQEIGGLDEATEKEINRARAASDPFRSIAAAQAAVGDQVRRAELQRLLRVVDVTGQGIAPRWALASLRADRDALMQRITFSTEARGEAADALGRALAGAAAEAGFTVDQDNGQYHLYADLSLDDLAPREGWYWVNGTLELAMRDADGRERGVRRWEIKAASEDPRTAHRRAFEEAAATLQHDLASTVLGFASGESDARPVRP